MRHSKFFLTLPILSYNLTFHSDQNSVDTNKTQDIAALLGSQDYRKPEMARYETGVKEEHLQSLKNHAQAIKSAFKELSDKGFIPVILQNSHTSAYLFGMEKIIYRCADLAYLHSEDRPRRTTAETRSRTASAQRNSASPPPPPPLTEKSTQTHTTTSTVPTRKAPTEQQRHGKLDAGLETAIANRDRRARERAASGISNVTASLSSLQMSQRPPPPARAGTVHTGSPAGSSFTPYVRYQKFEDPWRRA